MRNGSTGWFQERETGSDWARAAEAARKKAMQSERRIPRL